MIIRLEIKWYANAIFTGKPLLNDNWKNSIQLKSGVQCADD